MAENFPNLKKETDTHIQEAQSPKQGKPKHTKTYYDKYSKSKIEDSKGIKKKKKQRVDYKGTPIRLSTDFYTETPQARQEWQDIFKSPEREKAAI